MNWIEIVSNSTQCIVTHTQWCYCQTVECIHLHIFSYSTSLSGLSPKAKASLEMDGPLDFDCYSSLEKSWFELFKIIKAKDLKKSPKGCSLGPLFKGSFHNLRKHFLDIFWLLCDLLFHKHFVYSYKTKISLLLTTYPTLCV